MFPGSLLRSVWKLWILKLLKPKRMMKTYFKSTAHFFSSLFNLSISKEMCPGENPAPLTSCIAQIGVETIRTLCSTPSLIVTFVGKSFPCSRNVLATIASLPQRTSFFAALRLVFHRLVTHSSILPPSLASYLSRKQSKSRTSMKNRRPLHRDIRRRWNKCQEPFHIHALELSTLLFTLLQKSDVLVVIK